MIKPCRILVSNSSFLNNPSFLFLGYCNIIFPSTGSRSKNIEHVGPIISSRKIMWIGVKMFGYFQPNNNGSEAVKIIGM
jgi:hypothetical protein